MTSFDTSSPQLNVWRALLALAVVFVMLATTGWTALRSHREPSALQASLAKWEHGRLHGLPLPDPEAGPARLARFFAALGHQDRDRLAHRYPLAVGNMNGAPVTLRYQANRVALDQARRAERQRTHDPRLSSAGRQDATRRVDRYASLLTPGRHILAFDPQDSGRVAEVFGDLDRAQRISVVVPGVDTDLLTFQRTYRKYSAPVGMAEALYAAERDARPGTRTAVIAWADYTAPDGLGVDAATGLRAEEGAVRLNGLLRALPGRAKVAMVCHSYGSVVCGVAARGMPARVTDIAVAASPGMRVTGAGDLGTRARVWAMRDATDWVRDVPYLELGGLGHGADPVSSAFGARVLSARDAQGHAGYFQPGTDSLRNLAEVGVGGYAEVTCARENDTCRAGLPGAETAGRA
ncbi:alpha/beta hydrolase family protein [Streptomyces sp. LP11]|uniref:Alpha/beta hydrolase family protein n=1 Tax=Streptomyces pyxinicus TaxID=2970331 RepID=A0ABT2AYI7_9ACTN|nr:alpha/beta hydrolase family protein [Streptomyces sp. LP11]MCS0601317.1 alpha/beta hydrolase family protein [Streptomyces sp. LP11]